MNCSEATTAQSRTAIVWFRQDLRTDDNPALAAAAKSDAVIPVYIWDPDGEGDLPPGAASRWWLHQSLVALDAELRPKGSRLVLRRGASADVLRDLIRETGAEAVFWNRRYEPAVIERDQGIKSALKAQGIDAQSFNSGLLFEPWTIETKGGTPYQVFTPFWKACLAATPPARPLPSPKEISPPDAWPESLSLDDLQLEPKIDWANGIREAWTPGTCGARQELQRFLKTSADAYSDTRDLPATTGTSRLSPHLHFGEISPRRIWHKLMEWGADASHDSEPYLRQLVWREFAHHLLYHFPHTTNRPLRSNFENFPWATNARNLKAWQQGRTGYPFVDAGMRELWTTGWMHNRVRMVVASFLVKDLLISWTEGARWFWDTLVDADLANNTLGWQWTAGCGADAAPFFRVFNPMSQGQKFDPDGGYVRRWVPELALLPNRWIHAPFDAPADVLETAGIALGRDYPHPIVDHAASRQLALDAYAGIRTSEAT